VEEAGYIYFVGHLTDSNTSNRKESIARSFRTKTCHDMNLTAGNHLPPSLRCSYEMSKFFVHEGMCITDAQKADICTAVLFPTVSSVLTLTLRNIKSL